MDKLLTGLILMRLPITAICQNNTTDNQPDKESWNFDIAPYLWFSSLKGDISFQQQSVPVEAGFKDILDQLSFGVLVHAERVKDPGQ